MKFAQILHTILEIWFKFSEPEFLQNFSVGDWKIWNISSKYPPVIQNVITHTDNLNQQQFSISFAVNMPPTYAIIIRKTCAILQTIFQRKGEAVSIFTGCNELSYFHQLLVLTVWFSTKYSVYTCLTMLKMFKYFLSIFCQIFLDY